MRGQAWRIGALAGVLALALVLRLRGLDFGLPALLDPDEPIFVLLGLKLLKDHTLNPGWFGHPGTTTIYSMALVEAGVFLVGHITGRFPDAAAFSRAFYHDPGIVFLPGRVVILISALLTIALTYRLARQLFDTRVALLAAALLAIDPIHIRYSQIIRTDMQATIFILLAALASVRIVERGRTRDYVVAGIWVGVGCATKWPSLTVAIGIVGAAWWRFWRNPPDRRTVVRSVALAAVASVAACVVVSPYLVLDAGTLISDLHGEQRGYRLGATGSGLVANVGWYVAYPLRAGLGMGGLVLTVVGFCVAMRRNAAAGAVLFPVTLVFLVSISAQHLIWERWTVPLLPLLTIATAYGAVCLVDVVRANAPKLIVPVSLAITLFVALAPLKVGDAQARERRTDTRRQATRWAARNIPAGSTVAIEYLAFDVLDAPWTFLYPAGDKGCVDVRANLSKQVTVKRIGGWRGSRPQVNFGGIEATQAATCRADYLIIADYDRYLAERNRFPEEVANYRRLMAGGSTVAVFRPNPGAIGGPIVRIVRLFDRSHLPRSNEVRG